MRLNEFLKEETTKMAVFAFGRMNPPTVGHEKLINAVEKIADGKSADSFIIPTKTHDGDKNPLDFKTKAKFLHVFFPKVNIVEDEEVKNIFDAMYWFAEQEYDEVTLVVGSDRVSEFQKIISAYVPSLNPSVDPTKAVNIKRFSVASAGDRDPDSSEVAGASGTKARQYAKDGNEDDFILSIAPSTGTEQQKIALYKAVRKGLGIT